MKRFVTMMMAMVMMFDFGSVSANAAKRDESEVEVYGVIANDEDFHPIGDDGVEKTAVLDKLTLETDGENNPTISGRKFVRAYAKWKGIKGNGLISHFTSKLILVEDSTTGHDIGWRFSYGTIEKGKIVTKTVDIPEEHLRWEKYLTEIYNCL